MRPLLRTALLTVTALTALTIVLLPFQPTPRVASPLAAPVTAQSVSSEAPTAPAESLAIPSGLASNRHGAPHFSTPALPETVPSLRPELRSAYWLAIASAPPSCHLTFSLLAAIARVESGSLDGHHIDRDNRVVPALIGAPLNGRGRPAVPDTDAGQLDQDPVWDRPIGPLQLVPAVWRVAGVDLDGDGTRDPHNVFDAAGAAMVYLCAEDRDLSSTGGVEQAVRAYNDSPGYLRLVLSWQAAYERQEDQLLDLGAVFGIPSFAMAPTGPSWDAVDALLEPLRRLARTGEAPSAVTGGLPGERAGPPTSSPATSPLSPSGAPVSPSDPAGTPGPITTTPPATPPPTPHPTPVPSTAPPAVVVPSPGEPGSLPELAPEPAHEPAPVPDPTPDPTPDPAPTCAALPSEIPVLDPNTAPSDLTALCPDLVDPLDPVDPVPTP